jgi:hypothetical protein
MLFARCMRLGLEMRSYVNLCFVIVTFLAYLELQLDNECHVMFTVRSSLS